MASVSEYPQQLEAVNLLLEQTPEGPERSELLSLKQNIEELLSLTVEHSSEAKSESNSPENDRLDDEYMRFMAEMGKEGAIELSNSTVKHFKELEGKKFRAPHKHQWGQLVYHNAMICSVPDGIDNTNELQVKVLFLNPTHKEMLPCPYFFDLEKDCHFSEEQCRFSHGELVYYSSLQDYIEPNFEDLAVGSEVLAKQSDNLWYRGKIAEILKERCLVKFESRKDRNENYEEIIFEHILPLEQTENGSDDDSLSSNEYQVVDEWNGSDEDECTRTQKQSKLINMSLMNTPDTVALGDWEKYTKGIGSKLMQKMGYIVGTGLGKQGSGIIKPVTAQILPQGKSLDFCMNLKEQAKNPDLFNADNKSKKKNKAMKKMEKKATKKGKQLQKLENMDLDQFIMWYIGRCKKFENDDKVQEKCLLLVKWIREAKHVVVHTGAGISTAAGIPDFRGPNGVWTLEKEGKKPDINISFNEAIPTKTHMALKHLVDKNYVHYIISQNIDGLHLRTGVPRTHLAELHGNMFIGQCDTCDSQFVRTTATSTVGQKYLGEYCKRDIRGRSCRGKLKDTILDWEAGLPEDDLEMSDYHSSLADVNICLGTTLQIVPSGNLPLRCKKYGGKMVIVNLQPTKHDKKADLIINTYVDTVLEAVMKQLRLEIPEYSKEFDPTKNQLPISIVEWNIPKTQIKMCKKLFEAKQKEYRDMKKLEPKVKKPNGVKSKGKIKKEETIEYGDLAIRTRRSLNNGTSKRPQAGKGRGSRMSKRTIGRVEKKENIYLDEKCVDLTLDSDDEFME